MDQVKLTETRPGVVPNMAGEAMRANNAASTHRLVTAMREDLHDALREHGKDSDEYAKMLDKASIYLRSDLPELLEAYFDYSASSED